MSFLCAVCGNARCELGESCFGSDCAFSCTPDCPIVMNQGSCPLGTAVLQPYSPSSSVTIQPHASTPSEVPCSGVGMCVQPTGRCSCFAGYTGPACDACAYTYTRLSTDGPCVLLPGSLASCANGVRDGNELGIDCGGPNCHICPDSLVEQSKVLSIQLVLVISLVVAVFVSVCSFYLWHRIRLCRGNLNGSQAASTRDVAPQSTQSWASSSKSINKRMLTLSFHRPSRVAPAGARTQKPGESAASVSSSRQQAKQTVKVVVRPQPSEHVTPAALVNWDSFGVDAAAERMKEAAFHADDSDIKGPSHVSR